ncbi:MAG: extracellular solute-binding protein [Candidatus Doudnabacteria bacterium]|nr:extracellular solute-binding protein [Candidatus Doudnabacteria bacterium]
MKQKILVKLNKLVIAIFALALVSAGCGGGENKSAQKVTLNIWGVFDDSQSIQPLLDSYRKLRPNVQVIYTKKDINNYQNELLNALAAGTGPDIYSIHNDWLPSFLDKTSAATSQQWQFNNYKNDFVDVVVRDFTKDQKVYGIAISVDSLALYYNKDLLGTVSIATPARTWEQLSVQAQLLKKQDSKGYFTRSGVAIGTNSNVNRAVDVLSLFMLQQGAQSYSTDGTRAVFGDSVQKNGNYTTPGLQALRFYTSFSNPQSPNYNWNSRSDYSIDAFANGRAAYLFGYSYFRNTIINKAPNLNFDVAEVPQPNLDDPKVNFANYWGYVVSKQSKFSDYAWDFLKQVTTKDALSSYYAQTKVPSSRRDLIEFQTADPEIGVFASSNLTAKSFYKPDQTRFDNLFGQMIENIILKGFSEEEALNQAEQQASTLVRQ